MSITWELDFYSRPILDENQKKLWEVVICESPTRTTQSLDSLFRYAKFCPSQTVNSVWLREAIQDAIAQSPTAPNKVRFFRKQMNNMITKACKELELLPQPSRRTYALNHWLQHRFTEVYPQEPGYDETAATASFVRYQSEIPQPLPDALRGEKWAFVSLEAQAFREMAEWEIAFTEAFSLELSQIAPGTLIPGLIIYSSRALPLAAWMSGLEMAFVKYTEKPARLVLETGANDGWILASLANPKLQAEAEGFEQAKRNAQDIHFMAVQTDPEAESFAGFWLLQEVNLG